MKTDLNIEKLCNEKAKLEDEKMEVLEKALEGIIKLEEKIDAIVNDLSIVKKLLSLERKANDYQDRSLINIYDKLEKIISLLNPNPFSSLKPEKNYFFSTSEGIFQDKCGDNESVCVPQYTVSYGDIEKK